LHRAARRRHATPIDSDRWYADMLRRRRAHRGGEPQPPKPSGPSSLDEVEYWLKRFADESPPIDEIFPPGYGEEEG
jgi:hypothetical protein